MRVLLSSLAAAALSAAPLTAQEEGAGPEAFAGRWEAASDDGTSLHAAELAATGGGVSGRLVRGERGYFSGNVEIVEDLDLAGSVRDGVLEFSGTLATADGQQVTASGSAFRRGDYLLVRVGTYEVALAPPGMPLEVSAEGSEAAAALARLVGGREYSAGGGAHGRGAFVGGRVRLALCADGSVAYSRSDLVATPGALPGGGVDGGSSWSRQGRWSVVLYAGQPTVRADWHGTGTSYSLVDYIRIEPAPDGSAAVVDGTPLPFAGRC